MMDRHLPAQARSSDVPDVPSTDLAHGERNDRAPAAPTAASSANGAIITNGCIYLPIDQQHFKEDKHALTLRQTPARAMGPSEYFRSALWLAHRDGRSDTRRMSDAHS